MKHTLTTLVIACMAFATQQAQAQSSSADTQKTVKKTEKKTEKKTVKKPVAAVPAGEDKEPDISAATHTNLHCELGNEIAIYRYAGDSKVIALRWNKRLHSMTRVDTSTGADRFENNKAGLVWIGISAKGMLLDSKHGRQLANECKSKQQNQTKSVSN